MIIEEEFELSTAEELADMAAEASELVPTDGACDCSDAEYTVTVTPVPSAVIPRAVQIQRLEHQIAGQSLAILRLSEQQAFAKKLRDTLTESLRQLLGDDEPTDEDDEDEGDDSEWVTDGGVKQGVVDPAAETSISKTPASSTPADKNAWRSVTVEQLGLKESICRALRENPERTIATLGDIADWSAAPSLKQLTDIPKIGESKATAIINACDAYWAKNPQPEVQATLGTVGQALAEAGVTTATPEGVPAKSVPADGGEVANDA